MKETSPKINYFSAGQPYRERGWTWWLVPRPFDLVSSLLYIGVLLPYLYSFVTRTGYIPPLALWQAVLMIVTVVALLALDRIEYRLYGEETPRKAAICLLLARIAFIEVISWLDEFRYSPFLYFVVLFLACVYFGEIVGYGLAMVAWIVYFVKHMYYSSNWLSDGTQLHYLVLFTIGLALVITIAHVVAKEKASRLRSEELFAELEISHQQLKNYAEQVEELATIKERNRLARERERIEQELRTAHDIQHTFLPKDVPTLPGWQLVPYYQPAREVGGDFYDFLPFADGRMGLVIGDVTDKGVPAALVMATTHTMLRTAVQEQTSPGEVFARVNELLSAEIPPKMFVTCFYAILDPSSGRMRYANAGHDLPYRRQHGGVSELWATGMPLGLMTGTHYEEYEITIAPGESLLFYTDGLVEAHNPSREMFSFPRLKTLLAAHADGASLIDLLLSELKSFTGEGWEQEDDVTLVVLQRTPESLAMNAQSRISNLKIAEAHQR